MKIGTLTFGTISFDGLPKYLAEALASNMNLFTCFTYMLRHNEFMIGVSHMLLENMDQSVSPCDDFYQVFKNISAETSPLVLVPDQTPYNQYINDSSPAK